MQRAQALSRQHAQPHSVSLTRPPRLAALCQPCLRCSRTTNRRQRAATCSAEPVGSPFATSSSSAPRTRTAAEPQLPYSRHEWVWKDHRISYLTAGCGEPIVLVHGFGYSAATFRKTIPFLAQNGYKVYAIDLLGFGNSDKPVQQYSMELWAEQLCDFVSEFTSAPAVLVGNSVGSLACLMASAAKPSQVRATVLLNSAGAMNNKGVLDDWRVKLVYPLLLLIDLLLSFRGIALPLFEAIRQPENIRKALKNVYVEQEAVDDELVRMLCGPSVHPNALDVFVSVLTGPPGPKPWDVMPRVPGPMLIAWGDKDGLTPSDGPFGKYFKELPASRADTTFVLLEDVGHVPQDDNAHKLHAQLLPWLKGLKQRAPTGEPVPAAASS